MNKWEQRFVELAKVVATWSKDPDCQVGAVLVDANRRIVGTGYNGLPACCSDDEGALHSANKNTMMIHAEVNAVTNATTSLQGCSMFITKPPCVACAAVLAMQGLDKVYCPVPRVESKWHDSNILAISMLNEQDIQVLFYP